MAVGCCNNAGLLLAAAATLLLLPKPFRLPPSAPPAAPAAAAPPPRAWADVVDELSALDLLLTFTLILFGVLTYLAEFVQRKLMERRIAKLNEWLSGSVRRLKSWDAQQQQLAATLRLVRAAATEYNLLLYLLLARHRSLLDEHTPPLHTLFDKGLHYQLPLLE